uniref:Uncharacterized protein n=1 Tax=Monodelphis domestica TaxID=13616 RepID=A0A5F8GUJ0_MONDO
MDVPSSDADCHSSMSSHSVGLLTTTSHKSLLHLQCSGNQKEGGEGHRILQQNSLVSKELVKLTLVAIVVTATKSNNNQTIVLTSRNTDFGLFNLMESLCLGGASRSNVTSQATQKDTSYGKKSANF